MTDNTDPTEPPDETTDDHLYPDGLPYDIVEPVDDAPLPYLD